MEAAELFKVLITWVVGVGGMLAASITYLFYQVVNLNHKVGQLEITAGLLQKEVDEYKACPATHCPFRLRNPWNPPTQTISANPKTA